LGKIKVMIHKFIWEIHYRHWVGIIKDQFKGFRI
jgi:hypothetical protein